MDKLELRGLNLIISPGTLFMSTVPSGFIFRLYTKVYAVDITYRPQLGVYVDFIENPSPVFDSKTVDGVTTSKMFPNMDMLVETLHYPALTVATADQIMTFLEEYRGTRLGILEEHMQSLRSFLYQQMEVEKTQDNQLDVVLCDDLILSYPFDDEEITKWGYVLRYKVSGRFITTYDIKLHSNHKLAYHKESVVTPHNPTGIDEGAGYAPGDDYRTLKSILAHEDSLKSGQLTTLFVALDGVKTLPQTLNIN